MGLIFGFVFLIAVLAVIAGAAKDLPSLVFEGFSWAENLEFDGIGHLFVSEAVRGELWRIQLNSNQTSYEGHIFLNEGFTMFGGLSASPDGLRMLAGATFEDDSHAIVDVSTQGDIGQYKVLAKTSHHPNGMACDWVNSLCYYTDEGTGEDYKGTVNMVDIVTGVETLIKDHVAYPDGVYFDQENNRLYVAELASRKINVFTTSPNGAVFQEQFLGLHKALNALNIIDDITLFSKCASNEASCTTLLAADWTGKSLQKFSVDGTSVSKIPAPGDIKFKELTSVKWGKGPGFDEASVYVTEGGGVVGKETNRRVIQVKL